MSLNSPEQFRMITLERGCFRARPRVILLAPSLLISPPGRGIGNIDTISRGISVELPEISCNRGFGVLLIHLPAKLLDPPLERLNILEYCVRHCRSPFYQMNLAGDRRRSKRRLDE